MKSKTDNLTTGCPPGSKAIEPETQTCGDSDNITSVTLHVRPRPNLPAQCLAAFLDAAIELRSIDIMWERDRPGWQRVNIQIKPCSRALVTGIARRLSEGDSRQPQLAVTSSPP